ncbi:phosphoenolpyruvate synthase [Parapedomonas caeni]
MPQTSTADTTAVLPFSAIGLGDVARVGGKTASLGELRRLLGDGAIPVPDGFAVTADAYRAFIAANDLAPRLAALMAGARKDDLADFARRAAAARALIEGGVFPPPMAGAIRKAYAGLDDAGGAAVVAIRSSATAEDLPGASFAGQHDSYLDIVGPEAVLAAVRRCFASLYTDRAISYRLDRGFAHEQVALSVAVQRMVDADHGASGVLFTLDPETGFRDVVLVTGVYGLGETIVQGRVEPDEFLIHKPGLTAGFRALIRRRRGAKALRMIRARRSGGEATRTVSVPLAQRRQFCISDDEALALARVGVAIEQHYSAFHGQPTPMDIEWARDGVNGGLFIVQARPETVHALTAQTRFTRFHLRGKGPLLTSGQAVGEGIASGPARRLASAADLPHVRPGDVIVASTTAPDWEPVMKTAAAIVTEHGGRTCHAAIIARELGVPAVVGAAGALARLADGADVTVSCAEGETGRIYAGRLAFDTEEIAIDPDAAHQLPTRIMLNLGNPDQAFRLSALPVDGVGLARIEFIISESIRAHPMALLQPERVIGKTERRALARLTADHADGAAFFVDRLAEGIARIAAAFYPRPVIVRTSDFKSNEYAALLGGRAFELDEANPMIGFRGAARYAHPAYRPAFDLECQALKRVRDDMGLGNVKVMIPFCRRLAEADATLAIMAANGLERGINGLEIYVMSEIPANVVLVDEFARRFDGFSIGSNDLTQLTLGVDRDSDILRASFDERDPAVTALIAQAIAGAHRNGRPCGICGQAPSDHPDVADWLVEQGIDSISLNPDSVLKTIARLAARSSGG